jgi:glycerol-3-phosphate acyltransferase PlsX
MSIGEEETKGNDLSREAFERLRRSDLNFIGNLEGKDLFSGKADIVVSDGFTGNVALKVSEGVVEHLFSLAKREIMGNVLAKIGFLLLRRNLRRMYKKFDYAEVGGAQLLGLNGVCIIGHGRSDSRAVMNAIRRARDFVAGRVQDRIRDELARAGGGVKIG